MKIKKLVPIISEKSKKNIPNIKNIDIKLILKNPASPAINNMANAPK